MFGHIKHFFGVEVRRQSCYVGSYNISLRKKLGVSLAMFGHITFLWGRFRCQSCYVWSYVFLRKIQASVLLCLLI